jgi:hypothetical protein
MSEVSAVLGLPYIQPAQAQKHVTHNEALRVLDVIVQLAVLDRTQTAAPISPDIGSRYIVGEGALGEWSGQDGNIAVWDIEGWVFFQPQAGWRAEVLSDAQSVVWTGAGWIATGAQPQTVSQLGIGTSADATNRLAVSSAATLLSHAGAGHQIKVNKAAAGDTASLLFQTNFSGRAEMGLAGNDDFSIKVSADGISFLEGVRLAQDGSTTLPNGALVPDGTPARPGLRFSGDTDTGIGRPGADQIAFITGGSQRALLSSVGLQINVPMSGTSIQSTSHDTTPGRLGRVAQQGGLFGLGVTQGGSLGDVLASANIAAAAGLYRTDPTTTNLPVSAPSGLLEVFHGAGGDTVHQRWSATTADQATRTWQRRSAGGTWQAWSLVFNQSTIVGPVTQVAGIPTGAILERNSNTNGEFVRFADGTQICSRTNLSAPNASTASGTLFRSTDVPWTFPIAFASAPVVSGGTDSSDVWCTTATPSSTSVNMRAMSSVSRTTAVPLRALAIGRWF